MTLAEGSTGGTTNFSFTVTLSAPSNANVSLNYATADDSATQPEDYMLKNGTLTFLSAGSETTKNIVVAVAADLTAEPDETFFVNLTGLTGPAVFSDAQGLGTIINDDSGLSIAADASADQTEGNSGTKAFGFTVTRSGDTSGSASVNYAVGGSETDAADFTGGAPTGTVSFAAGESSKPITVSVSGDIDIEPDESFTVTLSGATGAGITGPPATGTIRTDDIGLSIAAADADKLEGDTDDAPATDFTFTVTRTGDTSGTTTVDYALSGTGTDAADAADFVGGLLTGTVTFDPTDTTKTITIPVNGDTVGEPDEGFTVTLSGPSAPAQLTTSTASGTIRNDDIGFSIVALDAVKAEGNTGSAPTTPFTFTVTRSSTTGNSSVDYAVTGTGGTSADVSDFDGGAFPSGSVNFGDGEGSKTITIDVVGDTAVEGDEQFTVTLETPVNGTIISGTADGTIQNDDSGLQALPVDASKDEGNTGDITAFQFSVVRLGNTSGAVSVEYSIVGSGTNPAGAGDFSGSVPAGMLTWADGDGSSRSITVLVAGDNTVELDETFDLVLSNPVGASISGPATGTIINDDADLDIAATDADKLEGNSGTNNFSFTITRLGDLGGTVDVNYAVTGLGGAPADAADFVGGTLPSGTASFADGASTATVMIPVNGDTIAEPDEAFTVTLSNVVGNAEINTASANGTIQNDDAGLIISATDAIKKEGNSSTTNFSFEVTRSGDTTGTTTVNYAVSGNSGDPADAIDFAGGSLPSGVVTFNPTETLKTVSIPVQGDTTLENDEGFTVTLSGASGGTQLITTTADGTILNDEITLAVAATDADKIEGDSGTNNFTFTITRSGDTSGVTTVDYTIGGAVDANDFVGATLPSGNISFGATETTKVVNLPVNGDTTVEPDEPFTLTLSNPSGLATIATAAASGTIRNDDALISIAPPSPAAQAEGDIGDTTTFTFTVSRNGDVSQPASVDYAVTGGAPDPADADDFVGAMFPAGTVNFAANESSKSVDIQVRGDDTIEANEQFVVTLSNPSAGSGLGTATATATITDDEVADIKGRKFLDTNPTVSSDDATNPGLAGWTIELFVDVDNDSVFEPNGPFGSIGDDGDPVQQTTTNSSGDYAFGGLTAGTNYWVREVQRGGWQQTAGNAANYVAFNGTPNTAGGNFGNSACRFQQLPADGDITVTAKNSGILSIQVAGGGTFQVLNAAGNTVQPVHAFEQGPDRVNGTDGDNDDGDATPHEFALFADGFSRESVLEPGVQRADLLATAGATYTVRIVGTTADSVLRSTNGVNINASSLALVINGSDCGDTIVVEDDPASAPLDAKYLFVGSFDGSLSEFNNGQDLSNRFTGARYNAAIIDLLFGTPTISRVEVNGNRGDDIIRVNENVDKPATLTGGDGNDLIRAGNGISTISGLNGSDFIVGGSAGDVINGGNNDDFLFGLAGADRIFGNNGNDVIGGGDDNDPLLRGGNNNDRISGGHGADRIIGDSGTDTAYR